MEFINRNVLWLLPVIVLWSLLWWIYGDSKRRMVLKNYMRGQAVIMVSYTKRFWRRALMLAGLVMLTLAAARPCWGERPLEFNVSQTDVLVVFDVSRSMLAEDVAPSRLEHGKWLLRELIKKNPRAAFGIVPFAGKAYLACPVTGDPVSLEQSIEDLNCDVVPVGGTNLSAALQTALKALKAVRSTVREIVLITDGEELTGDITKVLDEIKKSGIRLLVLGLGDPAVPALIPETDEQNRKHFKRDSAGELVRTRLNEELLRKVAAATGGIYINSNALNTGLEQISAELAKNDSENSRQVRRALPIERFMIFLFAGTLLVILSLLIDEKGLRRRVNIFLAALVWAFSSNLSAQESAVSENGKDEISSEIKLEDAADTYKVYNQARKLQLAGRNEPAAELYNQLNTPDAAADVRAASLHNSGVIVHTAGRIAFAEAVKKARSGSLDGALKELDGVEKSLNRSGEFYINTMQLSADDTSQVQKLAARNQQQMLLDLEEVKKFRKTLEDLKKMQQQAQQQTQQAQQKNQQQQKQQNQQNQQKNQQQQKQQNQQNQQNQQAGNDAQKSLQDAQQKVNDLQKKSAGVSPAVNEQAKKAADALKKAEEKQKKGDYSGAEKDIKEALENLGEAQKSDQQDNKSGQDGKSEKNDKAEPQNSDKNDDKEQSRQGAKEAQEQNKMDAQQSDALMQLMGQDEKILRDAVKRNRQNRIAPVEKDW